MPDDAHADSSYDAVPYDDRVFYRTHPDVLATIAILHGLDPPSVERCRVLELGCAVGGNLLPMGIELPDAELVGIDLSPAQIATGRAIADAAGIRNVRLEALSITDVDASLGQFDYVVCHGVYSWVPPAVQEAIFRVCAERLTPRGIAYVSYNTYPGWHLRGMVRELMQHHARRFDDPTERVREARAFLELAITVQQARDPAGAYGAVLRDEARMLREAPDDYVFHEHLEDHNAPVYFRELVSRAAARGLAYVDDARPRDTGAGLPAELRASLEASADSPIEHEQYVDLLTNRTFRRSLFCHDACRPDAARRAQALARLWVSARVRPAEAAMDAGPGVQRFEMVDGKTSISTDDPALKTALARLGALWPRGLPFTALGPAADDGRLAEAMLRCYLAGVVELHTRLPTCALAPGVRPRASALARLQAERQSRVTNLLHRAVVLHDADALLLRHLDGARDRAALIQVLTDAVCDGRFRLERDGAALTDPTTVRALFGGWIEPALERLATAALLVA